MHPASPFKRRITCVLFPGFSCRWKNGSRYRWTTDTDSHPRYHLFNNSSCARIEIAGAYPLPSSHCTRGTGRRLRPSRIRNSKSKALGALRSSVARPLTSLHWKTRDASFQRNSYRPGSGSRKQERLRPQMKPSPLKALNSPIIAPLLRLIRNRVLLFRQRGWQGRNADHVIAND